MYDKSTPSQTYLLQPKLMLWHGTRETEGYSQHREALLLIIFILSLPSFLII